MSTADRAHLTEWLQRASGGDRAAVEALLPVVYDELRGLAGRWMRGQRDDHTLQPTALVNEAFLRMFGDQPLDWQSRVHFFKVAAAAMRTVLVDHARRKNAQKRNAGGQRLDFALVAEAIEQRSGSLPLLDDALNALEKFDARAVRLVELRFFGGRTMSEVAEILGMSVRQAEREWAAARAWLKREVGRG